MTAIQAIILGIIQGLTEFIPVSSSGHLVAVPYLLGWDYQGKAFDVAVHLGSLMAVIVYYRKDWFEILASFFRHITKGEPYAKESKYGVSGRLFVPILIACIPAAIVGYLWNDPIEEKLSAWYIVAPSLVIFGIVMMVAERYSKRKRRVDAMNYMDYITIGVAQAMALIPGVSRSGITISAGLFRNLERAAAARFSFLLSTPIILGAAVVSLKDFDLGTGELSPFILGFISAAISGYVAIGFLMRFLEKRSIDAFAYYRFVLAVALVGIFLSR